MLTVGLTGGIASGKSTVCRLFQERAVDVVDADVIARQVVAPGSPGLAAVVARFGAGILDADGGLDRAAMRQLVFDQPAAREQLEQIVHPLVREQMWRQVAQARSAYCVLDIPLLVESGLQQKVDRVLVVDLPVAIQRYRLRQRDHANDSQIDDILAVQASRARRLAAADDVIDNSGDVSRLRPQVDAAHQRYLALAQGRQSVVTT